jgi:hypothetical protein
MKNLMFALCFLPLLLSCKPEYVQDNKAVQTVQTDSLKTDLIVQNKIDTTIGGEWVEGPAPDVIKLPYTRIKKGKYKALGRCIAEYHVSKLEKSEQTEDFIQSYEQMIMEFTFSKKRYFKDRNALSFELYENKIYMEYNTIYVTYSIPLSLVQQYLE